MPKPWDWKAFLRAASGPLRLPLDEMGPLSGPSAALRATADLVYGTNCMGGDRAALAGATTLEAAVLREHIWEGCGRGGPSSALCFHIGGELAWRGLAAKLDEFWVPHRGGEGEGETEEDEVMPREEEIVVQETHDDDEPAASRVASK